MDKKKINWFLSGGGSSGVLQRSLAITAANQAPFTQANPALLNFYNGSIDVPFTISCDVKWVSNTALQFITEQGKTDRSIVNFQLRLNADGAAFFIKVDAAGNFIAMTTNATIGSGWKRIIVTHAAGIIVLYVDGNVPVQTPTSAGVYTHMTTMDANYLQSVASASDKTSFPATSTKIDNLTLYNKALNGTEILELTLAPGGDPTTTSFASSILSCYKFNNNLLDSGADGYNLSSVATPTYSTDVPT